MTAGTTATAPEQRRSIARHRPAGANARCWAWRLIMTETDPIDRGAIWGDLAREVAAVDRRGVYDLEYGSDFSRAGAPRRGPLWPVCGHAKATRLAIGAACGQAWSRRCAGDRGTVSRFGSPAGRR